MKYGPGVYSKSSIQNGMKEWIECRRSRCSDPRIYNELPQEVKVMLDSWISTYVKPGKKERASYGMKAEFQRKTGIYIYTGVLNGAMLKAGYKPVNPNDKLNWHFKIHTI